MHIRTYIVFLGLSLLYGAKLAGQCATVTWLDENLQRHHGCSWLYTLPEYRYVNAAYKKNRVSGVALTYQHYKTATLLQNYNAEGYLVSETSLEDLGSKKMHRYFYQDDHCTVIDSITIVVTKKSVDALKPPQVVNDTLQDVERWIFDAQLRLRAFYNPKGFINESANSWDPNPDSTFYEYDGCGNCRKTTEWTEGTSDVREFEYSYPGLDNGSYRHLTISLKGVVAIKASEVMAETLDYNEKGQLTRIHIPGRSSTTIEYNANNTVKLYSITERGYEAPFRENELCYNSYYKYKGSTATAIRREVLKRDIYTGKYKIFRTENLVMECYPNRLIKTDFSGNRFSYTYRK